MSEDLIKRSDAIKAINLKARIPHDIASAHYAHMAINAICSAPSADRPQGEWIDNGDKYFRCSLCGTKDTDKWHWCHGCGNPMKGADDE